MEHTLWDNVDALCRQWFRHLRLLEIIEEFSRIPLYYPVILAAARPPPA
jgi:hypothetical protein